jgi:hypothetical protein
MIKNSKNKPVHKDILVSMAQVLLSVKEKRHTHAFLTLVGLIFNMLYFKNHLIEIKNSHYVQQISSQSQTSKLNGYVDFT